MLAKSPAASMIAVIALALGVGVCTVMYSIVYGTLLRGLPVEGSDRIMYLQETHLSQNIERMSVPLHDYLDWRAQQTSFEQLGAYYFGTVNISGKDRPERFNGAFVTANTLTILGVRPLLGRLFLEGEDHPAAEPVVVLGFSVWRDRYDSDPEILGQTIRANGMQTTVVGIMPEGFEFPGFQKLWLPIRMDPLQLDRREGTGLTVFGRLHQGVSLDEARAELGAIAARLESEHHEPRPSRLRLRSRRHLHSPSRALRNRLPEHGRPSPVLHRAAPRAVLAAGGSPPQLSRKRCRSSR